MPQIQTHTPISGLDLAVDSTNYPSAAFILDFLNNATVGTTSVTDVVNGLAFAAGSIEAGASYGVDIIAIDQAITGILPAPGTASVLFFKIGTNGAGGTVEIGDSAATGGILITNSPIVYGDEGGVTATTAFTTNAGGMVRCVALDFGAGEMTPYEYIASTDTEAAKTATSIAALSGMSSIAQQWSVSGAHSDLAALGLLYFDNGLPSANSILAACRWMYHEAITNGVVSLPPWWKNMT